MSDRVTGREAAAVQTPAGTGAGENEAEGNILGHLLRIEADAASLVDDAQAEADRRVAESEKQNRSRYDEVYAREAAELDRAFEEEITRIRADYQNQLEAYRKSLDAIPVDQRCFSALMDELLTRDPARETFPVRVSPQGL
ncbi:MAG: hypothetical protein LBP20_10400 [Treponema sp.]|jgi:cell division septum initiation protein DivIVA|nr:hypothetical protein [Treponema sp.]